MAALALLTLVALSGTGGSTSSTAPAVSVRNRALHRMLVNVVTVEYRDAEGSIRGAQARVIDFNDPAGNDWAAVNQPRVVEYQHLRWPVVVVKSVLTEIAGPTR